MAVLGWALVAGPAAAATLTVGPHQAYTSITEAVQAAAPGDTIRIEPGRYREHLVIDRPLTLVGEPGAVIDGGGDGDVVTLAADGITLQGLTVRGSGQHLWRDHAAIKVFSSDNRIEGNRIEESLFGILVIRGDRNRIRENTIVGLAEKIEHDRGDGIRLYDSDENLIEGNVILQARDGIYVEYSSRNRIARNRVEGTRIGLHYMFANDNLFEENLFVRNGVAAAIMYSKRLQVRRNVFSESRGYGAYGLFLKDAEAAEVEGNLILANETGISLDFAVRSHFQGNYVAANEVAVRVLASSGENTFVGNAFVYNGDGVYLSPGRHQQYWDDGVQGNYWSSYRGYDLDGDGIGDVPYDASDVFGHLTERFPELKLFFQSPAVQAIAFCEEAFPVFQRQKAVDRYPLMQAMPPPEDLLRQALAGSPQAFTGRGAAVLLSAAMGGLAVVGLHWGRRNGPHGR
ncbi:nitrous oxide reductase family maturation protein NosD [Limnochorda sp.]|uniref:nitrous oxide reductase family maturation protein NosD n=1 Tax=Limnochorda sp. TaxID=1940279 RepID=UPI0039C12578